MRNAYLMCDFSFSLSISSLTKVLARCQRDLTTPLLCSSGWLLRKLRYWSLWVPFLYTLVLMHPSFRTMIVESKKPNDLSLLSSVSLFFRGSGDSEGNYLALCCPLDMVVNGIQVLCEIQCDSKQQTCRRRIYSTGVERWGGGGGGLLRTS